MEHMPPESSSAFFKYPAPSFRAADFLSHCPALVLLGGTQLSGFSSLENALFIAVVDTCCFLTTQDPVCLI